MTNSSDRPPEDPSARTRRTRRRVVLIVLLAVVIAGWWLVVRDGGPDETPPSDDAGGPNAGVGMIGAETSAPPGAEGRIVRTSTGREIRVGTVDPLGYSLPLDMRRPGKRPGPTTERRPGAERPGPRTDGARGVPFVEHRLGPDDGHTQNETSIAIDGATLVAGWNQYDDTGLVMGVGRSTDGGASWVSTAFTDHTVTSDPAVRAGGGGRWYYAYLATGGPFGGGSDYDIFVRRSTDDAATWETPVDATQNASFDDKPYIDARSDEVLLGWADFAFSPAKVRAVRSLDGGLTFGANTILAQSSVGGNGACPVIGPEGTYYMFWRDSFQDSLWISRSVDQGTTWTPDRGIVPMSPLPSSLLGGFRIVNLPSADANPITGELLVVWNDQALGDPDILAIRSADGGVTWSAPVRVNDDATGTAQFFPWVAFDPSGVAHCVWYDRRLDGFQIDVYVSRSLDGGATWEPNVRVTAQAFTPVLPWDTTVDFIGDYNGIAAGVGTIYPFYQDSRAGEQDVYVALVPSDVVDVPGGGAAVPVAHRLVASPNPFRDRVRIALGAEALARDDAASGPTTLDVFDASGRRVRELTRAPGDGGWTWDGAGDTGDALPPGVYHAEMRGAANHRVKIVKVR